MRDLIELQKKTEKMSSKVGKTGRSLREAAKKLDDVWRNCKTAHAVGVSAGIVGGLLSIGGGIATLMTAGAASPLLVAGLLIGGTGAAANVGTAIVEALINSAEVKEAEKQLAKTRDSMNEVNRFVQEVLVPKEGMRLIYMYYLAKTLKLGCPVVMMILRELVVFSAGTPIKMVIQIAEKVLACAQATGQASTKAATLASAQGGGKAAAQSVDDFVGVIGQAGAQAQAADDVFGAGAKVGSETVGKAVGKVIIGVNAAFVVWDAIDLGFTIKDLVENKGSEAAKVMRQKADELESAMNQ